MARRPPDPGQGAFDLDAMIHELDVAAAPPWAGAPLHFTVDYYPPADLDAAFAHWQFLHGSFASVPVSHMWHRAIGERGPLELGDHRLDLFTADLRCDRWKHPDGEDGHPVACTCLGDLMTQTVCEPCGWNAVGTGENHVVEAWHDHAVPGWRTLPVVPAAIRVRNDRGLLPKALEWIAEHYPPEAQAPGMPIITERHEYGTRHVSRYSPWGGYDLSHTALGLPALPRRDPSPRARRLPPPKTPKRQTPATTEAPGL